MAIWRVYLNLFRLFLLYVTRKKKMNGASTEGLFTANGSLMVAVRVVGWDERPLKK